MKSLLMFWGLNRVWPERILMGLGCVVWDTVLESEAKGSPKLHSHERTRAWKGAPVRRANVRQAGVVRCGSECSSAARKGHVPRGFFQQGMLELSKTS